MNKEEFEKKKKGYVEVFKISIKTENDDGEKHVRCLFEASDYMVELTYLSQYFLSVEIAKAFEQLLEHVQKMAQFEADMMETEGPMQ